MPDTPAPAEMVKLATQLIEEHTSPFVADQFQNSYEVALMDLVKRKSKGKTVIAREGEPSRAGEKKVVDLMEALRKSVTGRKSAEKAPAAKTRKKAS